MLALAYFSLKPRPAQIYKANHRHPKYKPQIASSVTMSLVRRTSTVQRLHIAWNIFLSQPIPLFNIPPQKPKSKSLPDKLGDIQLSSSVILCEGTFEEPVFNPFRHGRHQLGLPKIANYEIGTTFCRHFYKTFGINQQMVEFQVGMRFIPFVTPDLILPGPRRAGSANCLAS